MNDTTSSIEIRMAQMIASRTPLERLKMASSMYDSAKALMRASLKSKDDSLSEAQIRTKIFLRIYGDCYTHSEIHRIVKAIPNMHY